MSSKERVRKALVVFRNLFEKNVEPDVYRDELMAKLAVFENPYAFPLQCSRTSKHRGFLYFVAGTVLDFVSTNLTAEQRLKLLEPNILRDAFQLVSSYPQSQTFDLFEELYRFKENRTLLDPFVKRLAENGHYDRALAIFCKLELDGGDFLIPLLLPVALQSVARGLSSFHAYLKNEPIIARRLFDLLDSLIVADDETGATIALAKGHCLPERIAKADSFGPKFIVAAISWMENKFPDFHLSSELVNLNIKWKSLNFICKRKAQMEVGKRLFNTKIKKIVPLENQRLQALLWTLLARWQLYKDGKYLRQYYSSGCQEIEERNDLPKWCYRLPDTFTLKIVTSSGEFQHMLDELEGHKMVAVAGTTCRGNVGVLQIAVDGRVFVVKSGQDVGDAQWGLLCTWLNKAELILCNNVINRLRLTNMFAGLSPTAMVVNIFELWTTLLVTPQFSAAMRSISPTAPKSTNSMLTKVKGQVLECELTRCERWMLSTKWYVDVAADLVVAILDCFGALKQRLETHGCNVDLVSWTKEYCCRRQQEREAAAAAAVVDVAGDDDGPLNDNNDKEEFWMDIEC